jgi:hypothetical protein
MRVRDNRHGEQLWQEWDGSGLERTDCLPYYTVEHVDLGEEVVRRALASTLQRDGVADSLADGFKLLDGVEVEHMWAGILDDEDRLSTCDEDGETFYGDSVAVPFPTTIVYISY